MEKIKNKIDKYKIIIILIMILGCAVRIIGIDSIPSGLNTDEASAGYEAYSIANYGIDRNGKTLPVFLESWGSGQNALYIYMIIPFVKLFGLSVLTMRLPMAIAGCISLFVMYKILKMQDNKKLTVIVLAFFAIVPWHIMKSRWGLESNIFPEVMLWAVYFLINGIHTKKIYKFYIGAALLGLCSYAYGTSYYFLPVFSIIMLVFLVKKKYLLVKQALISLGITAIISLPIMLMVLINSFNLQEIKIFNFTIPRLESNRYETETLLSSDNIRQTISDNITEGLSIIVTQNDKLTYNAIPNYGIIYMSSLPIMIIGLVKAAKNKNIINSIFSIWLISALLLIPICYPNINRINILFIPLIYFTGIGLYELITNKKIFKYTIILLYSVQFLLFGYKYINTVYTQSNWNYNLENVLPYINNLDEETIYFEYSIQEPYIFVLFYNKIDTNEYVNTVKKAYYGKNFENIIEFGKYKFYIPEDLEKVDNGAVVIRTENLEEYNINETIWNKTYIDDYVILRKK